VGGDALQPHFIKENIDIIISAIIYLSAFALLIKGWIAKAILRGSAANANIDLAVAGSGELSAGDPEEPAGATDGKNEEGRT
jgi:hypothetical protein